MPELTHHHHAEAPPKLPPQKPLIPRCDCGLCEAEGVADVPFIGIRRNLPTTVSLAELHERLPEMMRGYQDAFFEALAEGHPRIGVKVPALRLSIFINSDSVIDMAFRVAERLYCPLCGPIEAHAAHQAQREFYENLMRPSERPGDDLAEAERWNIFGEVIKTCMDLITAQGPCQDCARPQWHRMARPHEKGGRPPSRCPECQALHRKNQVRENVRAHRKRKV